MTKQKQKALALVEQAKAALINKSPSSLVDAMRALQGMGFERNISIGKILAIPPDRLLIECYTMTSAGIFDGSSLTDFEFKLAKFHFLKMLKCRYSMVGKPSPDDPPTDLLIRAVKEWKPARLYKQWYPKLKGIATCRSDECLESKYMIEDFGVDRIEKYLVEFIFDPKGPGSRYNSLAINRYIDLLVKKIEYFYEKNKFKKATTFRKN